MWTGRFQQATDAQVRAYGESISFDWRLYAHDIEGSVAHAAALAAAGLLTENERARIEAGLRQIGGEIARGEFPFRTELEDIHMNIESVLTARIGPAGAKLHTARSRNDQVALDLRLYLRAEISEIRQGVRALQSALAELGARYPETAMPGYTHLQRAQPVLFAHHLLAYVEMLSRDDGRFADTVRRLDVLPLGSGPSRVRPSRWTAVSSPPSSVFPGSARTAWTPSATGTSPASSSRRRPSWGCTSPA